MRGGVHLTFSGDINVFIIGAGSEPCTENWWNVPNSVQIDIPKNTNYYFVRFGLSGDVFRQAYLKTLAICINFSGSFIENYWTLYKYTILHFSFSCPKIWIKTLNYICTEFRTFSVLHQFQFCLTKPWAGQFRFPGWWLNFQWKYPLLCL